MAGCYCTLFSFLRIQYNLAIMDPKSVCESLFLLYLNLALTDFRGPTIFFLLLSTKEKKEILLEGL